MKVVAAYLLAVLGGNASPCADDLKDILGSVGAEADDERIELLLSEVKGKDITELIAAGREKLASVPAGGGGGVAMAAVSAGGGGGAAAAAPAAAESKKEEKVEEKEESDDHVEALEILLQGLCGVHKERLRIHELCLKSAPNLGLVSSEVRLLCDLEQPEPTCCANGKFIRAFSSRTVRHVGGAMRGAGAEQISVLVRTMVESKVSKNVLRLFYTLGYKLDHELLRVGFAFHFQRVAQITVTVSSVNKMLKLHATDEAVPVTPGIQLVEVTAPASSENYSEVVAAVSSFCEYLAP
ncbi:hypothetical protein RHSIM_Rhsim06G0038600 [Rhododendron simsii]|uniref:Mediator of RNA polymerase II transcription subunit 18 n=1 Tax=Rhododendron simsii TaxID=118357 RepID=A0A834LN35_RHOSS|nr:hypothetical protein RHSIM_Rhsim06G0038600 [Rhododendron simsii]